MELLDNGKYKITVDDVLNNSEITQDDLDEVYGEKLEMQLLVASNKVYSIMLGGYRGWNRDRQLTALNYLITNDENKQNGLRDAIIEYIRGALISGMDLKQYTTQEQHYSNDVIDILRENDLWYAADLEYLDGDLD